MSGKFLLDSNQSNAEINIYADKSSLILEWLLLVGIEKKNFSLREVARERRVSVGLVQKVFSTLVFNGYLKTEGTRTSKRFILSKPESLLNSWLDYYSIVKKCKMWTYSTAYQGRKQLLDALQKSDLHQQVVRALHSSADAHKCNNTNLQTLELYILNLNIRPELEKVLQLEPQERGYGVLLIEPYYKKMINVSINLSKHKNSFETIYYTHSLLTFLDLFSFPLRGREQSEFMADKLIELKRIYRQR